MDSEESGRRLDRGGHRRHDCRCRHGRQRLGRLQRSVLVSRRVLSPCRQACAGSAGRNFCLTTSGQRTLTKGRIAKADFFTGKCNVTPSCGSRAVVLSCRYWGSCTFLLRTLQKRPPVLLSRPYKYNPPKLSLLWGDPEPPYIHGSLCPRVSAPKRHLDRYNRFLHSASMWLTHRHTHIHADLATYGICRSRPHLCYACDVA